MAKKQPKYIHDNKLHVESIGTGHCFPGYRWMGYTTILHEFGHTHGLGDAHTAARRCTRCSDLICGVEIGHKTCLSLPTDDTTPSVLDVNS